jgi:hypothetical protein
MIHNGREYRETGSREYAVDKELTIGKQQGHERPEQDEMVDAKGLLQYTLLGESVYERISNPGCHVLEPVFRSADGYQAKALYATPYKQNGSDKKNHRKDHLIGYH